MKSRYIVLILFMLVSGFTASCIVPFEKIVFDGEEYWGPNGSGYRAIYFPAYSSDWNVEISLIGEGGIFDLVVAAGMLSWDDYNIRKEDPVYQDAVYFVVFNQSEVEGLIGMNLPEHYRTVRILVRTHENGVTFNGQIIARCLAFRYLGWGNVYDHI